MAQKAGQVVVDPLGFALMDRKLLEAVNPPLRRRPGGLDNVAAPSA